MKKILSMLLVISMLLSASAALAEIGGVQIIGGPALETETVSLDDAKLNTSMPIDGYGDITLTSFEYLDKIRAFKNGSSTFNTNRSGDEADYALLKVDILNTTLKDKNYIASCEVKVVYDDVYEFAGWFGQYDWDLWSDNDDKDCLIANEDIFAIKPMYVGHYCFGSTLPNAVVNGKAPLKMIITIDGNEITYNIRK